MFTLAFLTDPHIAPLPRPSPGELMSKRIFGFLNWQLFRRNFHNRPVLDALTADLLKQNPDHIAVGGDLVNLSLKEEFGLALDWLQDLGSPEQVSVIPGNHDAYVPMDRNSGIGLWDAYMTSDVRQSKKLAPGANGFPWVRRFGKIALVGLSSAVPKPPGFASGELGEDQRAALTRILRELGRQNFYRIVMIHHPPLAGLSDARRGLDDAIELESILRAQGAELVLYGHRHWQSADEVTQDGKTMHVVGGPSASCAHAEPDFLARYNLFRVMQTRGRWRCEMTGRGLKISNGPIVELERKQLAS